MAWIHKFSPDKGEKSIGQLHCIWNAGESDEFVFSGSVNLDHPDSAYPLQEKAKAVLAEMKKAQDPKEEDKDYEAVLATLEVRMNSVDVKDDDIIAAVGIV